MNKARRHGILMMLALLALPLMAQQQFTLEDLNFGGKNYRQMIPQSRSLKWWGDQLVRPSADTCWTVDVAKGKEKVLFTRAKLNKRAGLDADTMQVARLSGVSFPYADQPLVMASNRNERLLINFKTVKWNGASLSSELHKPSSGTRRAVPLPTSRVITCMSPMLLATRGR